MAFQDMANNSPQAKKTVQLQAMADNHSAQQQQPIQKKENNTGLPDNLKTGMENLSGMSLDDVKVHRNSDKPAQLEAHATAQDPHIDLAAGQEKHLPHELGHIVQQREGRVKPTKQLNGETNINDDPSLENEADVLGAKALQLKGYSTIQTKLSSTNTTTVQRNGKKVVEVEDSQNADPIKEGEVEDSQKAEPIEEGKVSLAKKAFNMITASLNSWNVIENSASDVETAQAAGQAAEPTFFVSGEASTNALSGMWNSFEATVGKILTVFGEAASSIINIALIGKSISTIKDKNTKYKAFDTASKSGELSADLSTDERNKNPQTSADVAEYAKAKTWRGWVDAIYSAVTAMVGLAGSIATIVGAFVAGIGAAVGVAIGISEKVMKSLKVAAHVAKAVWKRIMGTKGKNRTRNTNKLIDLAANGDKEAAQLILNMNLGMVVGSLGHDVKRAFAAETGLGNEGERLKLDGDGLTKDTHPSILINVLETLNKNRKSNNKETASEANKTYKSLQSEIMGAMQSTA